MTLEQLYGGATRKLAMKRNILCTACDGKGGVNVKSCDDCQGRGVKVEYRQFMPGMVQQVRMCASVCAFVFLALSLSPPFSLSPETWPSLWPVELMYHYVVRHLDRDISLSPAMEMISKTY